MSETVTTRDGRHTLEMQRELAHSVAKVWKAITEPAQLSVWWPLQIDELPLELGAQLRFYEGDFVSMGTITAYEPGRVIGFTDEGGDHEVRLELFPTEKGCLLVFTHTFAEDQNPAQHAGGWNKCFALLDGVLAREGGAAA